MKWPIHMDEIPGEIIKVSVEKSTNMEIEIFNYIYDFVHIPENVRNTTEDESYT